MTDETLLVHDESDEDDTAERDVPGDPASFDPVRLVEAALFTAGRPVGIDEIVDATGLDPKVAKQAVKAIELEYAERGEAATMEVGQAGDKWAMQLKTRYVVHAKKLANMEIPKKVLKTLALIAFHQPVLQSEIVDMVGSKAYDHIKEIHEAGLIRLKPDGLSKRLTTSPLFPEYFGIPATDTEQIRTYLAKKVGLVLKNTRDGTAVLSGFDTGPGEAGQAQDADSVPPGAPQAGAEDEGTGEAQPDETLLSTDTPYAMEDVAP